MRLDPLVAHHVSQGGFRSAVRCPPSLKKKSLPPLFSLTQSHLERAFAGKPSTATAAGALVSSTKTAMTDRHCHAAMMTSWGLLL